MTQSTIIYSDLNSNPIENSSELAYNLEAIRQSLDNLFNTPYGTRSFNPTYGHYFQHILGELMTEETVDLMFDKVIESISLHEPRVQLDLEHSTVIGQYEKNTYLITLVFVVKGLGTEDKFTYSIEILNEGT